jgi:hypothetical protein
LSEKNEQTTHPAQMFTEELLAGTLNYSAIDVPVRDVPRRMDAGRTLRYMLARLLLIFLCPDTLPRILEGL